MPVYQNAPFQTPKLLQKGVPCYLFGSLDQLRGNTNLYITNTALTTNVGVVTVQVITGPLPQVGNYISILNSTALGTVNRSVITATTVDKSTGAGTLTFAFTHANVVSAADTGQVLVEPAEVGETLTTNASSIACVVAAPEGDSQFTLPVSVTCPSLPTSVTVHLQAAIRNIDSEFTNIDGTGIAVVAGGVQTVGPFGYVTLQRGYVYRVNCGTVTGGTLPTIVAKIG